MNAVASRLCPFCMRITEGDSCHHCGKHTDYSGQPMHLPAGYVVSGMHPYVLGASLGQGGFGITYIALDMVTNERVAIKEYYPTYCSARTSNSTVTAYSNQEEVYLKGKERFLEEARTLKSLSDLKSIVNVLDFFEANNSAYLVMEYLDGPSLKEHTTRQGKFQAQDFLRQVQPLMEDLHRMHERGVIHRDIAPDNIIVLPDGQMKLIDFGAARSYLGDKSMTVVVKKGFAPIEQYFSTGSTASSDVYALAATIYYCITGNVPMDSAQRQNDGVALESPSALGAELSPKQEEALLKALEIFQKTRTQNMKAFLEDLTAPESPASTAATEAAHSSKPAGNASLTPEKDESRDAKAASGKKQKKAEKKHLSKKRIASIAVCMLLVIGMLTITSDSRAYHRACRNLSQGKYAAASEKFAKLGDYKDSRRMWEEAVYLEAERLLQEKQIGEALNQIALIPNHEKSSDFKTECIYQRGLNALEKKEYDAAYTDLTQLPSDYKFVTAKLYTLKTEWGKHLINTSSYSGTTRFVRDIKLTKAESTNIYNYLIRKDFYLANGLKSTHLDFQTRKLMLDALVGEFPLKESLGILFEEFSAETAESFIRDNRALISELWDIPVVQNIITEDWNLTVWLLGKWRAKNGKYINFYYKNNDTDTIWADFNLPWVSEPEGTTGYNIVNQELVWIDEEENELAKVYRFKLLTPNSMEVFCYEDSKTYTVNRPR